MRPTIGLVIGIISLLSLSWSSTVLAQQPQGKTESRSSASQQTSEGAPQAPGTSPGEASSPTLMGVLLSTESLLGSSVKNSQGEEIGTIKQLMINPQTGLVTYAVLSVGGFLGMGEKAIYVPWRAFTVARNDNTIVLHLSKQVLQKAPPYEQDKAKSQEEIAAYYDEQERTAGWGADTAYGRLYDSEKEQTITGQVVDVSSGSPMPGMASGIQIQVKTDADQTMLIQLGPEWYIERQDVQIRENDEVRVTGALVRIDEQPVLLARQVEMSGHTLTLRDPQGTPGWADRQNGEQKPAEPQR